MRGKLTWVPVPLSANPNKHTHHENGVCKPTYVASACLNEQTGRYINTFDMYLCMYACMVTCRHISSTTVYDKSKPLLKKKQTKIPGRAGHFRLPGDGRGRGGGPCLCGSQNENPEKSSVTLSPKPQTLNPAPQTLYPKP